MYCERVGEPGKVGFVPAGGVRVGLCTACAIVDGVLWFPDYIERVNVVPSVPVATPTSSASDTRGKVGSEAPVPVQLTPPTLSFVSPPTPAPVTPEDPALVQLRSRAMVSQEVAGVAQSSSAKYA
jgi:hypothetical protein